MLKKLFFFRLVFPALLLMAVQHAPAQPPAAISRTNSMSSLAYGSAVLPLPLFHMASSAGSYMAPLPANFYQPKVDFAAANLPYYVATGDLDGDGKADMITANIRSNTVSVFRNTSVTGSINAASFAPRVDFATGASPVSVAIGDVDGDGKADLVVANEDAASVAVFKNTSSTGSITAASFAAAVSFATGDHPYSVVLSDVDGDGKKDIATANALSNTLSVLRNTATTGTVNASSFAGKVDFATGANPRFVAAGDVDGDGKADLVVANELDATVSVLRNTAASGSITSASLAARVNFATGAHPLGIVIGDIDGDGKPELAVTNYESNTISVLHNTASAGMVSSASFEAKIDFATSAQPFFIALGDVDGDGKRDIAVANSVSNSMSVLHNNAVAGSITGSSFDANVQFAAGGYPLSVALGDLDGDGTPEAVTANADNTLSVFRTAGMVVPATAPVITSFSPATSRVGGTVTITGANFNPVPSSNTVFFGGVKATVTGGSSTSLTVTVPAGSFYQPLSVLNTANGLSANSPRPFLTTFVNPLGPILYNDSYVQQADLPTGPVPYAFAFADLNGDGKPDMAVVNSSNNTVSVTQNIYAGGTLSASSFAAPVSFPTGSDPRSLAVADVDGDGKPDIVVANLNSASISVFHNESGSGAITAASFAPAVTFATGTQPLSVAIGDLDGDGKPDLVTTNFISGTISLLRNTGRTGSITATSFIRTDIPAGSGPRFVALGDLDGDGKTDMAVANQQASTVSLFRNIATAGTLDAGSFAAGVNFTTRSSPQYLAIGDLNGDQKPEVVIACSTRFGNIDALQNNSVPGTITAASFAEFTVVGFDGTDYSVSLNDVNGDGKIDILSPRISATSSQQNALDIQRNQGDGNGGNINMSNFFSGVNYLTSGFLLSCATADLDGDGAPELAVLNASDNRVAIKKFAVAVNSPVPAITAVNPLKGPVGSSVTISGRNFNASASGNTVYFGGVKAVVTGATTTSLTVTVPAGTTYEPISVLNTGTSLIAYSPKPFTTTFTNPRPALNGSFYQTRRDFPLAGQNPYGVALGDLNGDGKPDLVVASLDDYSISTRQNRSVRGRNDNTSFDSPVDFNAENPFNVVLNDLDRDGKLDAITVNLNNSSVQVFKNTSSADSISFGQGFTFGQTRFALSYSVAAGDIDNDGRADIVFVNATNNTVSILKNLSDPGGLDAVSFSSKVDFSTGAYPRFVALSDIDGDGKVDILVANQNSKTLSVFRNISTAGSITTASFAPRVDYATGTDPSGLATGDLDGDGRTDVAVINHGSSTVSVFRNLATAGSITASSLAPKVDFATGPDPYALTITDADGDGRPELLVANSSAGTVSVLRNTSVAGTIDAASFAAKVDFAGAGYLISLATADMDGDGVPEIFTGNASSNPRSVSVLSVNAPEAALPTQAPVVASFSPAAAPAGATVTITGSGFNANPSGNTVYFGSVKAAVTSASATALTVTVPAGSIYKPLSVLNNTNGLSGYSMNPFLATFTRSSAGFAPRVDYAAANATRSIALGDLDGDGKPDVIAAIYNSAAVSIFRNTTTGGSFTAASLAPRLDLATPAALYTVQTADMDGDGKLDVVALSGSAVSIFRNVSSSGSLTTASFAPRVDITTGSNSVSVAIGDLDGDGKPDLAVSDNGSDAISLFRNIATPGNMTAASFEAKVDFDSYRAGNIAIADIDGDGRPDLIQTYVTGASRYDGSVAVLRNTSVRGILNANSFSAPFIFDASENSGQFSVFDIDGDGKQDIAFSSPGSITPVQFLQNKSTPGNLSLVRADGTAANNGTSGQAVGDLNGDGKPDLIVCDNPNNTIFGFTNKATPGVVNGYSFGFGPNLPGGGRPIAAVIGDLDGDGLPEITTANSGAATLSIYRMSPAASAVPAQARSGATATLDAGRSLPGMQVYPNPARDEFTLALSGLARAGSIEILNEKGQLISRRPLNFNAGVGSFVQRISLRGQPAGVYYVKVVTTGGIRIEKLVLQR